MKHGPWRARPERRRFGGIPLMLGVVSALVSAPAVQATDVGDVLSIHGFGGWSYGRTDGNDYVLGSEDGEYDNASAALNLSARPYENLTLVTQLDFKKKESLEENVEVQLDYAFAEWFFSDAARLRVGRVKHPYGLYAEVFEVGTVRPFFFLPQSIYGPQGFTGEAYDGVGLTGTQYFGNGWGVQYDGYLGEIDGSFVVPGTLSGQPEIVGQNNIDEKFEVNDVLGMRLNFLTPKEGLLFGFSAYQGDETFQGTPAVRPGETHGRDVYGAHVEYIGSKLWVRSEYGHQEDEGLFVQEGSYLEIAYKFTTHWQIATRYDHLDISPPGIPKSTLPQPTRSSLEHRESALGLNYWFNPSFVIKLSVHFVDGNRFAFPGDPMEALGQIARGDLENKTRLAVFGAQFSF